MREVRSAKMERKRYREQKGYRRFEEKDAPAAHVHARGKVSLTSPPPLTRNADERGDGGSTSACARRGGSAESHRSVRPSKGNASSTLTQGKNTNADVCLRVR